MTKEVVTILGKDKEIEHAVKVFNPTITSF